MVPNGLCKIDIDGMTKVAVVNTSEEPMVMRKGREVGEWEKAYWNELRFRDTPADILRSQGMSMSVKKRLNTLFELLIRNRNGRALPSKMQEIVENNNHVFAVEDSELTQTSSVDHDIDTEDTKPIRQQTRPQAREVLSTTPVLAQPDVKETQSGKNPYVIYTDTSSLGVGAVLCQQGVDEFLHPIYFASK
ncbi:unnamed protein product [Haemonchus placei]|uniref:RT_RNaseH_2 domain-containing protein n=1 Tax=Haemonchus placei TaxID=6290 RepID=A0A0N4VTP3_HAEPC|nr:unnamed protein product [Haemonchus placei]